MLLRVFSSFYSSFSHSFQLGDGQFTLYTGRCVVNDKILKHTFLTNVMRENKITDLYFDTRAHFIEEFNAMRTTCDEIQSLLK